MDYREIKQAMEYLSKAIDIVDLDDKESFMHQKVDEIDVVVEKEGVEFTMCSDRYALEVFNELNKFEWSKGVSYYCQGNKIIYY